MRNRKYRKKGFGISTVVLMVFSIAIMVLPMNVAAQAGNFRCVYIEGTYVPYDTTYTGLTINDFVNGTYENAPGPPYNPIFEWRLDFGFWNLFGSSYAGGGVYEFNFTMDERPSLLGGTLWIQATVNTTVVEWHCYYD